MVGKEEFDLPSCGSGTILETVEGRSREQGFPSRAVRATGKTTPKPTA